MDERERIARFLDHPRSALPQGAIGPGDDAAVLPVPAGVDLVTTTDLVSEGTHFFATAPPRLVGRFAATVNLSDLAAMGATPFGFVVAYGTPRDDDFAWVDGVAAGLAEALDAARCPLLGGDTKEAGCRTITGTALGTVPTGRAVRRGGARPGDRLLLTGPVGGPAAALALHIQGALGDEETMRQVLGRTARLAAGRVLREAGAAALVDLSDGLARSAVLLAEASDVRIAVDAAAVPVDRLVGDVFRGDWAVDPEGRRLVLGVGGEYELLAAVPEDRVAAALAALQEVGVQAVEVGRVGSGTTGAHLVAGEEQHPLARLGWAHFS